MKQSESIKELAIALCIAQGQMGGAVKDSSNPFFKSSYADLTSVIKAIKEPFAQNGLSFVQLPIAGEAHVGVTTMLMHKSGEWLQSEYKLPMTKRDPQAAGSAITYARRYALQALAGIPSVDDDGESVMLRTPESKEAEYKKLVNAEKASIDAIKLGILEKDYSTAYEAWSELGEEIQTLLWKAPSKGGCFTSSERAIMKTPEFRQAQ